jgi:hypothetical protein
MAQCNLRPGASILMTAPISSIGAKSDPYRFGVTHFAPVASLTFIALSG